MPAIARRSSSLAAAGIGFKQIDAVKSEICRSNGDVTPQKRKLRSDTMATQESFIASPIRLKSSRRCISSSPKVSATEIEKDSSEKLTKSCKSPVKSSADSLTTKTQWNPRDMEQVNAVTEALHVSTAPSTVVCREDEQQRILEFCKVSIEQKKAGSLYACGCPGTGKSLSMEKVKQQLADWVCEAGYELPDVLTLNCTSLTKTSEIFSKILGRNQPQKKLNGSASPLQLLQNLYSQKSPSNGMKMTLIIADELDYLITRDRAVLHDLFMLTTLPFSKCILIGIANAIDLADRFLPRLQSLNCKPIVVTFRAYSKDQILRILKERLTALPYTVFHSQALELCARKVAAASGDMRKALCVCRNAVEILQSELQESNGDLIISSEVKGFFDQQRTPAPRTQEINIVRIEHMAIALSKTYASPAVDTIQSLPQHQQIILCSVVKYFRGSKKETTVGELNKSYMDICKSVQIPPAGILEFSSMCRVLNDQGLLKLGNAREDKLKRVTLNIDEADVTFALEFDSFGIVFSSSADKCVKAIDIRASCITQLTLNFKILILEDIMHDELTTK